VSNLRHRDGKFNVLTVTVGLLLLLLVMMMMMMDDGLRMTL